MAQKSLYPGLFTVPADRAQCVSHKPEAQAKVDPSPSFACASGLCIAMNNPLYDQIDLSKPWDDPANKEARETVVGECQCPSAVLESNQTTYPACFQRGERHEPA
jgi:hypothetical protein